MQFLPKEYDQYVKKMTPNSPLWKNALWAFFTGGLICTIAQLFSTLYRQAGLSTLQASSAVSMTMIFLGALLTALGLYDRIARHAGAGTLVPITGFSNAVVSAAMEFRSEGLITGTCTKMFIVAGPVLVYGTVASIVYGLFLVMVG